MAALNKKLLSYSKGGGQSTVIHTTLYELIDAVIASTPLDEDHMTGYIVSHILDSSNIRLSKRLAESARE